MSSPITQQTMEALLKRELKETSAEIQAAIKKEFQNFMNIIEVWGAGPGQKKNTLLKPNASRGLPFMSALNENEVSLPGALNSSLRPVTAPVSSAGGLSTWEASDEHEWTFRHPRCKAWELTIASEQDRSLPPAFFRDRAGSVCTVRSVQTPNFPALASTPATPIRRPNLELDLQADTEVPNEAEHEDFKGQRNSVPISSPIFRPYARHAFTQELDLSSQWSFIQRWNVFAYKVFGSSYFEYFVGFLVLLNTVSVAIQTDYVARNRLEQAPWTFRLVERTFCGIFIGEIAIRITVYRHRYFKVWMWEWNLFDIVVVSLQFAEEVLLFCLDASADLRINFTFMRILHFLRIIRIIRAIRILRFIEDLRNLVMALGHSLKILVWAVLLLFLVIFIFGVWLTQLVSDSRVQDKSDLAALRYFGSLGDTLLSLFQCSTGGFDWRDAVETLMTTIHPVMALVFSLYIALAVLAVMNVVTGVFVDASLESARQDKDYFIINNVRELFSSIKSDAGGELSWEDFENQLSGSAMYDYFKAMDVDPSEAKGLFQLLDLDHNNSIAPEEFLSGCLRLRGPAKAMDLALLMHEVRRLSTHMHTIQTVMIQHAGQSGGQSVAQTPFPPEPPAPPGSQPEALTASSMTRAAHSLPFMTEVEPWENSGVGPRVAGLASNGAPRKRPPSVPSTPLWGTTLG